MLKNGTVVLITHFYSIHQIYIRINTSELIEYYNYLIAEVNKFYVKSKSKYKNNIYTLYIYQIKLKNLHLFIKKIVFKLEWISL